MAATPSSLATLSTDELATLTKVEAAIDAELKLKFVSGEAVSIRNVLIRAVLELNPAVFTELKSRYLLAGWAVAEYDSKEGPWLSLSEA